MGRVLQKLKTRSLAFWRRKENSKAPVIAASIGIIAVMGAALAARSEMQ